VSCAALVVVATFAIMAVDGYDRWTDAADRGLRQLSADIERQMLAEIDEIRNALERHDEAAFKLTPGPKCSSMDVLSKWFEKPEAPNKLGFPIDDNIYLHQVAWIGPNGKQIWKITSDSIGKKVSVPHRAYFKAVRDGGLFETHPDGPGFFLGPDRSITDGKFYTFLSIRSRLTDQQCESRARPQREDPYVAVATARLLSLDRMPLPAGDRPAQDHHVRVARQLAHVRRLAGPVRDRADIAERLLLAELPHRVREGGVVLRRPLGERRVPGPVHANESCHTSRIRPPASRLGGPGASLFRGPGAR